MTTLQVPSRLVSQTSPCIPNSPSTPASPSLSTSDMQEGSKKTMQTTVAIRDETPHHFKILPLRQVPLEKRPTESPCMNFDRPFAGPRLELPTLYQLAPDRAASACSFNSLNEDRPSVSRPGSPPPQRQRVRGLSSASEAKSDCGSVRDDELSVLGLKARDSLHVVASASLRSTAGSISQEDIAQALQGYDTSHTSFLHAWTPAPVPELTFDTSRELSASPGLVTPLTSTPSSESVRKTKSMHVVSSGLNFLSKLPLDPPALSRTAILQRRKRAKALSVSSLSTNHPEEENRTHNRKRHAIYGDSEWQVDLPPSDSQQSLSSSVLRESSPRKSLSYVTPPRFFGKAKNFRHTFTKSDVSMCQGLGFKDSASISSIPSIPSLPSFGQPSPSVLPLRVSPSNRTSIKSSKSSKSIKRASRDSISTPVWPPLVQEMMQELDEAIQEWQFISFVASF